jgi:hypothetical protein
MAEPKKMPDLATLQAALEVAKNDHQKLAMEATAARSREIDALNRLNAAQRALDEAIIDIRKSSPNDSEWGRLRQNRGECV